jgi:hypothetical protein
LVFFVSDKEIALNDCGSVDQSSLYFLQRDNARKQIELAMKIVFVSLPEFKSKHYNLTKRLWIGYSEYY